MLVKDIATVEKLRNELMEVQRFVCDIETDGLKWSQGCRPCGLAFRVGNQSYYIPVAHGTGINLPKDKVYEILSPVFSRKDAYWINHNVKFDEHMILSEGVEVSIKTICTLLGAHFINENESSFKLENLADKYLGKDSSAESAKLDLFLKANKMKKGDLWKLSPEQIAPYACNDVEIAEGLWDNVYSPVLGKSGKFYQNLFLEICEYQSLVCKYIERNGMTIDMNRLNEIKTEAELVIKNLRFNMEKQSWIDFNPNSVPQVRKLLKIKNTDRKSLQKIGTPMALSIVEYRKWIKALTTYYIPFEKNAIANGDNKVYPNFYMAGTLSGRLSCKDPNLQAIPRDTEEIYKVKQVIIPQEGYTLVSADYSQAELRLLTHYTKEPAMMEIFNSGGDIHQGTADIMDVSRQIAKGINFGIVYGIGAVELSKVLGCTIEEASIYLSTYHARFPAIRKLYNYCQTLAYDRKYIKMWTGRQRHFNCPKAEPWKAMSNLIQGGIAEVMRIAITKLLNYYKNDTVRILNQVHDDIIYEIKDEAVKKELPEIKQIMTDFDFAVPMEVEFKVGKRWNELKEMNYSVVAFDVGKTNGVAVMMHDITGGVDVYTEHLDCDTMMKDFLRRDEVIGADIWIVENFMLYPWMAKKQNFMPMDAPRSIGILIHRAFEVGVPIQFQNAGTVKPIIDKKTIKMVLNITNKHEIDAAIHLFYYLKKKGELPWALKNLMKIKK